MRAVARSEAEPSKPLRSTLVAAECAQQATRTCIAVGRLYQWVPELKKLIKLPWFAKIQPPAPLVGQLETSASNSALLETADKTAALRCAMPPRLCRVIMVARCHDLPRDLALVRKRHRTVGSNENVLRTCFYQPGPGVSSTTIVPSGCGTNNTFADDEDSNWSYLYTVRITNREPDTWGKGKAKFSRHHEVPSATNTACYRATGTRYCQAPTFTTSRQDDERRREA
ncbi:hypothetical protein J3F83DRAFT_355251 [Trichoderma novae-zelandiae]